MVGMEQKDSYVGDEAQSEGYPNVQVPDPARYCYQLRRYGKDLARSITNCE